MEYPLELEDGVEVRKDSLSRYRMVYKVKNKDGSWNWFNLITGGSWANILKVLLIVLMVLCLTGAYLRDVRVYREIATVCTEQPYKFYEIVRNSEIEGINGMPYFNISIIQDLVVNSTNEGK